jgi:UPF0755 protein
MITKVLKIGFILIILIIGVGVFGFLFLSHQFDSSVNSDSAQKDFVVEKGETIKEVSQKLEKERFISKSFYMETYIWWRKLNNVKAGTYALSSSMSLREIAERMFSGRVSLEDKITVPEGFTIKDIAASFAEFKVKNSTDSDNQKEIFEKEFIAEASNVKRYDFNFLKNLPKSATLEGFLFPDTYQIYRESSASDLILKMLENFDKKINSKGTGRSSLQDEIKKQDKEIYEVITLASIVQKEVRKEDEMANVAGVFYNRLRKNMRLESDATITFITGKKDPQPTYEDTRIDSSYNTYLDYGLPPGPIGNPGLSAIWATLFPASHDYLFFITRLDTGEAIFSKTGEEHLENKEKYLK